MKPKALLALATVVLLLAALLAYNLRQRPHQHSRPEPGAPYATSDLEVARVTLTANAPRVPDDQFPRSVSVSNTAERLGLLERLGLVPEEADNKDWRLARKTSWWGKQLDPKEFWKGRTLWADSSAQMAAHRHGRLYPPIPDGETRFDYRSGTDQTTGPDPDGLDMGLRFNDRESVFWDEFSKTHPRPSEQITKAQGDLANEIVGSHYYFDNGNPLRTTPARLKAMDVSARQEVQALGYPPEAFTDEALHWNYILEQRAQYEQQYTRTGTENTLSSSNFLAKVWVEPNLITQPLSDEQLKAANAWKMAYLQRLRREQTDESYINAYLQAWNLSADDVFGTTNR